MSDSYYDILGIQRDASTEDIKRAYRQKARETHPDINKDDPDAEEKFKKISEAYSVLSDANKRAQYDNGGSVDGLFSGMGGFGINIDDFISSNFGFMGRHSNRPNIRAPRKGVSFSIHKEISMFVALFGAQIEIPVSYEADCVLCSGLGGAKMASCGSCGGRGFISHTNGIMQMRVDCRTCRGVGQVPTEKCTGCVAGKKRYDSVIKLEIPKDFISGESIIVSGAGAPGINGGPNGDVKVDVVIKPPKINIASLSEEELAAFRKYFS